jgi:hypothetical protein
MENILLYTGQIRVSYENIKNPKKKKGLIIN